MYGNISTRVMAVSNLTKNFCQRIQILSWGVPDSFICVCLIFLFISPWNQNDLSSSFSTTSFVKHDEHFLPQWRPEKQCIRGKIFKVHWVTQPMHLLHVFRESCWHPYQLCSHTPQHVPNSNVLLSSCILLQVATTSHPSPVFRMPMTCRDVVVSLHQKNTR